MTESRHSNLSTRHSEHSEESLLLHSEESYSFRHSEALAEESKNLDSNNTESKAESTPLKPLNLKALLDSLPTPPPQGWERVRLGDIVEIQSGGTPSRQISEYWNGNINWLKSEVCQNCYVYENQVKEKITELGLQKSSAKILKKDSVLIALVGATIGKVGYLTFESTTNQNIAGLYPLQSNKLHNKYLYFACLGLYPRFRELGDFSMANLTFIKNLQIPLPPLQAQEQIVVAIEKVEKRIALIDSSLESLESKKTEILQTMLEGSNERERAE